MDDPTNKIPYWTRFYKYALHTLVIIYSLNVFLGVLTTKFAGLSFLRGYWHLRVYSYLSQYPRGFNSKHFLEKVWVGYQKTLFLGFESCCRNRTFWRKLSPRFGRKPEGGSHLREELTRDFGLEPKNFRFLCFGWQNKQLKILARNRLGSPGSAKLRRSDLVF